MVMCFITLVVVARIINNLFSIIFTMKRFVNISFLLIWLEQSFD